MHLIYTGAIYINSCPGEPFVPLWSLVYGSVSSAQNLLSVLKSCLCRKKEDESENSKRFRKIATFIEVLIILFLIAWFIAGCVWVFTYLPTLNLRGECPDHQELDCCSPVIYWFSLGLIIGIFIYSVVIMAICPIVLIDHYT